MILGLLLGALLGLMVGCFVRMLECCDSRGLLLGALLDALFGCSVGMFNFRAVAGTLSGSIAWIGLLLGLKLGHSIGMPECWNIVCWKSVVQFARATPQQPPVTKHCVTHQNVAKNKGHPLIVTQLGVVHTNCTTFLVQNCVKINLMIKVSNLRGL